MSLGINFEAEALHAVQIINQQATAYMIHVAVQLAEFHYETSTSTLNPFCSEYETAAFKAYRMRAESLHSHNIVAVIH